MKKYKSFSKRLSQRILMVFVLTITLVSFLVLTFSFIILRNMSNSYFLSELRVANKTVEDRGKDTIEGLYEHMQKVDHVLNDFNPLVPKREFGKVRSSFRAYNIIIDSVGNYVYHPDKERIRKRNFFDDIRESPEDLYNKLVEGLASGEKGRQKIVIDGKPSFMFYSRMGNSSYSNAVIVPRDALVVPTAIVTLVLILFIALELLAAYWVSRVTIRRSTQPLQLLAKSADEVAQGNFHSPLPELKYNDEICQLRDSFANMQQSLTEYMERLKTTAAQKAAIESELSIARDIQLSMVPTEFPERPDLGIYASMTPAKAVGGDLYDFFVSGNELYFCIGDVSGKGVPAALFMMETRSLFRAYATSETMPDRIVAKINHDLSQNNESCMFVTLFVGVLNLTSGEMRYCNGGHEAPFIIGKEASLLPVNRTFPVGVMADTSYQMQTVVMEPQSRILFYTDGLTEAKNVEEQLFGEARVFDELNRAIGAGQLAPKVLIENMTQAVQAFVGEAEQSDDLTLLVIERK